MRHAMELLESSSLSISKIAENCGYENSAYFTKIFKMYHGISPSVYKKKKKND